MSWRRRLNSLPHKRAVNPHRLSRLKTRYGDIVDPDAMKGRGAVNSSPLVYGSTNHGKLTADEYKKQYRVRLHQWGSSTHACVLPEKIWRFNASRPRRSAGSGSHFMAPTVDSAVVVGGSLLKVKGSHLTTKWHTNLFKRPFLSRDPAK